jgi:hypothetical protein
MRRGDYRQPEFLDYFVGREVELGRLENSLDRASECPGRLLVLCGESGVGKSRLAKEFSTRAAARDARVFWARWNARGTRHLSVFRVNARSDNTEVATLEVTLTEGDILGAGTRLREFARDLIAAIPRDSQSASAAVSHDARRRDSGTHSLVLIFDDLRTSDKLSFPLLRTLARELLETPSMILAVYDDAEVFGIQEFAEALGAIVAPADRITLRHLTEAEVARVVAHAVGRVAEPDALAAVYRITQGDPGAVKRVLPMLRTRENERLAKHAQERSAAQPMTELEAKSTPDNRTRRLIAREADYWTLVFGSRLLRLRHVKGLTYLSHLLLNPGQYFHVLDLVALEQMRAGQIAIDRNLNSDSMRQMLAGLRHDSGPVLDHQARLAYARRLRELTEELEHASQCNDAGAIERLREEQAFLMRELTQSSGLGGRSRSTNSPAERARVSVTHAIRSVIRKVRTQDADLAHHLSIAVRTGMFCSYVPDHPTEQPWQGTLEATSS